MADPRFFAKLDLGYFENPKISDFIDDDPRVPILHLRAILYCRQHLTDGIFPIRQVVRLASASYCGSHCEAQCDFCKAHDAGIFHRIDERSAEVHDYLAHQEPARKAQDRSAAAQKAARVRWDREKGADSNAKRNADGNAGRIAKGNAEERRGEESSSARSRRKPETPLPEDWRPNTSHESLASEAGLSLSDESFRFRNHALANDRRQRDWDAAFRTWLSKAKDYAPAKPSPAKMNLPEAWR